MRALLILACVAVAGCGRSAVVEGGADRLPTPFTLELRALSGESRSVYFVLGEDGTLRYGGGSDARNRLATIDVGALTEEERLALWRVVLEKGLLEVGGEMFPEHKSVEYEFSVRAGSRSNSFRCGDDDVPGLAELERVLFEMQAKKRFGEPP